jgi:hypothetical protein
MWSVVEKLFIFYNARAKCPFFRDKLLSFTIVPFVAINKGLSVNTFLIAPMGIVPIVLSTNIISQSKSMLKYFVKLSASRDMRQSSNFESLQARNASVIVNDQLTMTSQGHLHKNRNYIKIIQGYSRGPYKH